MRYLRFIYTKNQHLSDTVPNAGSEWNIDELAQAPTLRNQRLAEIPTGRSRIWISNGDGYRWPRFTSHEAFFFFGWFQKNLTRFPIIFFLASLRRKLRMRWFFDVSKVRESNFFKSDLTDPPSHFRCTFFGPILALPAFIFQWIFISRSVLSQMVL